MAAASALPGRSVGAPCAAGDERASVGWRAGPASTPACVSPRGAAAAGRSVPRAKPCLGLLLKLAGVIPERARRCLRERGWACRHGIGNSSFGLTLPAAMFDQFDRGRGGAGPMRAPWAHDIDTPVAAGSEGRRHLAGGGGGKGRPGCPRRCCPSLLGLQYPQQGADKRALRVPTPLPTLLNSSITWLRKAIFAWTCTVDLIGNQAMWRGGRVYETPLRCAYMRLSCSFAIHNTFC